MDWPPARYKLEKTTTGGVFFILSKQMNMNVDTAALQGAREMFGPATLIRKTFENDKCAIYDAFQPEYRTTGDLELLNTSRGKLVFVKATGYMEAFDPWNHDRINMASLLTPEEASHVKSFDEWYEDLRDWGIVEERLIYYIIESIGYKQNIDPSPAPVYRSKIKSFTLELRHFGDFNFIESKTEKPAQEYINDFVTFLERMYIDYEIDDTRITVKRITGSLPEFPRQIDK